MALGALDSQGKICRGGEGGFCGGTGPDMEVRGPGMDANGEVTVCAVMGCSVVVAIVVGAELVALDEFGSGSGGVDSLDFGNTLVGLGARSSHGKIIFGFVSSGFGFSGTSYHMSFGGSG